MNQQTILWLVGLLLGGNIYFIKRLIDKLEAADAAAKDAKGAVQSLGGLMREIKQDIKDLRRIEIDVAILKETAPNKIKKRIQQNQDQDRNPDHDGDE